VHRLTREERDLHGVIVNGSDHLTASPVAESGEQHGYVARSMDSRRILFEEELEEWAETPCVLMKAIEDTALGLASV